jgi:hypothetical protein
MQGKVRWHPLDVYLDVTSQSLKFHELHICALQSLQSQLERIKTGGNSRQNLIERLRKNYLEYNSDLLKRVYALIYVEYCCMFKNNSQKSKNMNYQDVRKQKINSIALCDGDFTSR